MSTQRQTPHKIMKSTRRFFELWKEKPEHLELFFELLSGRMEDGRVPRMQDVCRQLEVPYTLLHEYIGTVPTLAARFDAIMKANGHALVEEALDDADGAVCKDTAAAAKVKSEVKLKVASHWHREMYGERIQVDRNVTVTVDSGLLGTAAELLKIAKTGRVIEHEAPALTTEKSE